MPRLQSPVHLYCTCNCNLYTRQPSPYPSLRAPPAPARPLMPKNYQNSTGIIDKQLFRRLRTQPTKYAHRLVRPPTGRSRSSREFRGTQRKATKSSQVLFGLTLFGGGAGTVRARVCDGRTREIRTSPPNNHFYRRPVSMRCRHGQQHFCTSEAHSKRS